MSATINAIEDHVGGKFTVNVRIDSKYREFESVVDARKWLELMKSSSRGMIEEIEITLREIFISAKQQYSYETIYAI